MCLRIKRELDILDAYYKVSLAIAGTVAILVLGSFASIVWGLL